MIINQIKAGPLDNFSYLINCSDTRKAVVIDPARETVQSILTEARSRALTIEKIVNTHCHSDHTSGNRMLRNESGGTICMHILDAENRPDIDERLEDGDIIIIGNFHFKIIHTPGHTPGGICLYGAGHLFTGDTLFVGDSGRTDLAGGDRPRLGVSLRKLMLLNDTTVVWPGHDYGPTPSSTLGWEKIHNVNAREYGFYMENNNESSRIYQ